MCVCGGGGCNTLDARIRVCSILIFDLRIWGGGGGWGSNPLGSRDVSLSKQITFTITQTNKLVDISSDYLNLTLNVIM